MRRNSYVTGLLVAMMTASAPGSEAAAQDPTMEPEVGRVADSNTYPSPLLRPARLEVEDASIAAALMRLSEASEVGIAFSPNSLPNRRVSCSCMSLTVREALRTILGDTGFSFGILHDHVIVVPPPHPDYRRDLVRPGAGGTRLAGLPASQIGSQVEHRLVARNDDGPVEVVRQDDVISGIVINTATGQPLAGALVGVEGTSAGGVTDEQGRFRIATGLEPGSQVTLRVTRIGYRPITLTARVGDTSIEIGLEGSAIQLDEVIVTGTVGGTQRRALGHTVGQIRMDEVRDLTPSRTMSELLNARIPGAVTMASSGAVGASEVIRIRGRSSFSLPGMPLVYVDGVRVSGDEISYPFPGGDLFQAVNRLDDIDPNDIETIDVIKGPAAATLYGTEASNGVIQITTRQGHVGPAQFELTVRQGANWVTNPASRYPTNLWRDPSTGQLVELNMVRYERENEGFSTFRTGHTQGYALNVRGGSEGIRYYGSINVDRDQGSTHHDFGSRFSARGRVSIAANDRLDIDGSVAMNLGEHRLPARGGGVGRLSTTHPATLDSRIPGEFSILTSDIRSGVQRSTGSVQITHRPTDWLTHRLSAGLDLTGEEVTYLNPRVQLPPEYEQFRSESARAGSKAIEGRDYTYITIDYGATANWEASENVTLSTSAGLQMFRKHMALSRVTGRDFPGPGLTSVAGTAVREGLEDALENTTLGVYLQEQLSWRDRVFLTAAVRVDDNSAFGDNFNVVTYPKVSAAWVLSDEAFWNVPVLDMFRLRGAFGASGQQPDAFRGGHRELRADASRRTFNPVLGGDDRPGVVPGAVGNPDLQPERAEEIEIGFEAALLNERVGVDFTMYNQRVVDAILERDVAPSSGFYPAQQFVNVGELRNQGIEVLLNVRALERERHSLDITFNLSRNDNKVVSLGDDVEFLNVGWIPNQHRPGYPVASFFQKRVISADAGPDGRPINVMCDGGAGPRGADPGGPPVPCEDAPQIFAGRPDPNLEGAISSTLRLFDRWRIFGMIDFKRGHKIYQWTEYVRCVSNQMCEENAFPERFSPTWHASMDLGAAFQGDHFVRDHSFAKLRELSLTYSVPDRWLHGLNVRRASITIAGRNLHTWTSYEGIDPETALSAHTHTDQNSPWETAAVPPATTQFVFTVNVGF